MTPRPFPAQASQPQLFATVPDGHFTIAVRCDGRPSHTEPHADFGMAMDAGKQWLWNDGVAWTIIGYREGRKPAYTHRMVRRGEEIRMMEWDGRESRASRSRVLPGQSADRLG